MCACSLNIVSCKKVRKARLLQELHLPLLMLAQIHLSQVSNLYFCINVFLYFVPYGSLWLWLWLWFHQISSSANSLFRVATELWWRENFNAGRSHWGWPQGTFVYLKLINKTNQVLNNDYKIMFLTLFALPGSLKKSQRAAGRGRRRSQTRPPWLRLLAFGIWYFVIGIWYLEPGLLGTGIWYFVIGTWYLTQVFGIWYSVLGTRSPWHRYVHCPTQVNP